MTKLFTEKGFILNNITLKLFKLISIFLSIYQFKRLYFLRYWIDKEMVDWKWNFLELVFHETCGVEALIINDVTFEQVLAQCDKKLHVIRKVKELKATSLFCQYYYTASFYWWLKLVVITCIWSMTFRIHCVFIKSLLSRSGIIQNQTSIDEIRKDTVRILGVYKKQCYFQSEKVWK